MKNMEKKLDVKIIGDVMLDKYIYTNVKRISPEAPVPIAEYLNESYRVGGAANVALNFKNMGCNVTLLGNIGNDENGKILSDMLKNYDITFFPLLTNKPTTTKVRVIANKHQLLTLEKILLKDDIIIVSDYVKGFISNNIIEYINSKDNYKSIDTKRIYPFKEINGFNFIKPNLKEALGFSKELGNKSEYDNTNEDVERLGEFLKKELKTNILITRGNKGSSYIGENIFHNNIINDDVIDVTGAGDTCMAAFSIMDYKCESKDKCLEYMAKAAEITVSKVGTYAPKMEEFL
jgi:D-beta-D-heptose 7-phosphate kinase/D-beta-D-heptose 1-phosphate adenosyltransferase